jgi:putative hemolysin
MLTATFDGFPGMGGHSIFVCDSNGPSATSRTQPTREAVAWLREGHALILFPAAQGSWMRDPHHKNPVDAPWLKGTSLLIRRGKANVLPVYVHGAPGKLFLAMKRVLQPAAFVLLVREIVNQEGSRVRLEVGEALSHQCITEAGDAEAQVAFLRQKTYDLASAEDRRS